MQQILEWIMEGNNKNSAVDRPEIFRDFSHTDDTPHRYLLFILVYSRQIFTFHVQLSGTLSMILQKMFDVFLHF